MKEREALGSRRGSGQTQTGHLFLLCSFSPCKLRKWAKGKKREGLLTQKGIVVLGFRLLAIFNEEDQEGGRKACA